ncbi:MAG: hypothetical protein ABIK61_05395 [candidate division WOR-3 bacterium]
MPLFIIVIGASGIIAQITLIRELLVSFQGNELSIGFVLGNWLLAEALGSYIAGKIKISLNFYRLITISFGLLLPLAVVAAMMLKIIVGNVPGEIITFSVMFIASFIILFPVSFIHGALFPLSVSILTTAYHAKSKVPGYVYIFENLGTIIGGILIAFILIHNFSSLQIAFIISIINFIAVAVLIKNIWVFNYVLILVFAVLFFFASSLEYWLNKRNYRNYEVLLSTNTTYSNIKVLRREEQYTFLIDGVPSLLTPYPDINFVEDYVHFTMLSHFAPKKVLLVSGGIGGVLAEILKHPVERIDYLELDPNLIEIVKKFPTSLTNQELFDPRVKTINIDARTFLNKCQEKYDVIFINFLSPLTLQINRFFTKEFYVICKDKLNPNGILSTISNGSLSYINPELCNVINSHLITCKSVFANMIIIPGDFNLYLWSNSIAEINWSNSLVPETLFQRLQQRQVKTNLFSLNYIRHRIDNYWQDWLKESLRSKDKNQILLNQDGHPIGLFYSLVYWNTIANPSLRAILSFVTKINLKTIFILLMIAFIVFLLFTKRQHKMFLPITVFTTGVSAMIFTLILSLGFQIRYGYLYYQISILLTVFIWGNVLGGLLGSRISNVKIKHLLFAELILIGFIILMILSLENKTYPGFFNSSINFYLSLFIAGIFTGIEYPLSTRIYYQPKLTAIDSQDRFLRKYERLVSETAGSLYAADLLGGFISAILISAVFIPIIGIYQTLILALGLKIMSMLLVLTGKAFSIK